jgi:hypothetical protein
MLYAHNIDHVLPALEHRAELCLRECVRACVRELRPSDLYVDNTRALCFLIVASRPWTASTAVQALCRPLFRQAASPSSPADPQAWYDLELHKAYALLAQQHGLSARGKHSHAPACSATHRAAEACSATHRAAEACSAAQRATDACSAT